MKNRAVRVLLYVQFVLAALTMTAAWSADNAGNFKVANGVAIYFGIMPAEMVLGHPKEHAEREMHGGAPKGARRDHLVVALFDNATGERISDAEVTATVRQIGLAGRTKRLDPMTIAETVSYGNYFDLPSKDLYRIVLQIRRPGAVRPLTAEFTYRHEP